MDLGLLQIHGDDLTAFNDTEPDGRALNGNFSGNVLHGEGAFIGAVITPAINNSSGGALTLVFDSSFRTNTTGGVDVLINDQPTRILDIGQAYIIGHDPLIAEIGSIPDNQVIYQNTFTVNVPQAANQANVKFQFIMDAGTWWTIDNVVVSRGAPPTDVSAWEVY